MSTACQVRVTGPLARCADGFRADLAARGYAAGSADRNLRIMAHVSRWMQDRGLSAGQLSMPGWRSSCRPAAGRATTTRFPSGL